MKKIAYIIDSACLLNEQEAYDYGLIYLPLQVVINNKCFKEGRDLDHDYLIYSLSNKKDVATSQPSPLDVEQLIERLKKEKYDCAIYASIGSGLSSTLNNVIAQADSMNFKIYPLDSCCVGTVQTVPLLKVRRLIEQDHMEIEEALNIVRKDIENSRVYLVVDDLFFLMHGGRLTPAAAALGTMLKIKPLLRLDIAQQGRIDVVEKIRSSKKAIKMLAKTALDGIDENNYTIAIAQLEASDNVKLLKEEIMKINPKFKYKNYGISAVIAAHTGLNVVGILVVPK
ncbi:MAG: DegV family protein [Bacilli bacterium]|jgi:DegV family protein with EDD domain|nr:DegV family protein [Bacilli bacterium]